MTARNATALLLDGGHARRFSGRHKASLDAGLAATGSPGLESIARRTLDMVHDLCDDVIVATDRPEKWPDGEVRFVSDAVAGAGPLAGIAPGLDAARHERVLVLAADMPSLSRDVLAALLERAAREDRAVVPVVDGRPEPLHAVHRKRDSPLAHAALAVGMTKLSDYLERAGALFLDAAELAHISGAVTSFRNINSPEDMARLPPSPRAQR